MQEFPSSELKGDGVLVGPVLDISTSQKITCVEPVIIKIPLTLGEGKKDLAQLFFGRVRILHSDSGDESHTWEDITEQLEEPAVISDGIVTFKVEHYSRLGMQLRKMFHSLCFSVRIINVTIYAS